MTADESKRCFFGMIVFQIGVEFGDAGTRGVLTDREASASNSRSKSPGSDLYVKNPE